MTPHLKERTEPAPVVAVVITAFNQDNYIGDAIQSVRNQSRAVLECIIVDDGSTDRTYEVALTSSVRDPRFRVLRQENSGPGSARNHGFRLVSKSVRYLVFLDGDDMLAPTFVEELSNYLDENSDVAIVTCAYVIMDSKGVLHDIGRRTRYAPGILGLPHNLRATEVATPFVSFFCATGQGPFALLRRSHFAQTDGYDESFWPHEDTDMFCQMALLAKVHHLGRPLYWKRDHIESIMRIDSQKAVARFSAFKADAYDRFRKKWDNRTARSNDELAILFSAKAYYYLRHKPARDLKVALRCFRELLFEPRKAKLVWLFSLIKSATLGFLTPRSRIISQPVQSNMRRPE
jgi:glycosyltransferase involved in cell wall biosynthesis